MSKPRIRYYMCFLRKIVVIGGLFTSLSSAQQMAFSGTLRDYLDLPEEGVRIGDTIFSNFQSLDLQQGASGFNADFIDVIPLTQDIGQPGFRFDILDGATAEDFFELRFSFDVSGLFYNSAMLGLSNVSVRSDTNGGIDTLLDISETGGPAGSLGSLISFAAPGDLRDLDTEEIFAPNDQLTLEFDTVIDGGGLGRQGEIVASIRSATVQVGVADPQPQLLVRRSGLLNPTTFYIEFSSDPSTAHVVTATETLADGFPPMIPLTSGDGVTDVNGFGRVEFDISTLGPRQLFRLEKATS